MCLSFFFFKQKTAYEMRISDWSSDVCSSDLGHQQHEPAPRDREIDDPLNHGSVLIPGGSLFEFGLDREAVGGGDLFAPGEARQDRHHRAIDRKSTRLNSSH